MDNIYIMQHNEERWTIDGEHGRETFPSFLTDEEAEWLYRTNNYLEMQRDYNGYACECACYGEPYKSFEKYAHEWLRISMEEEE